MEHLAPPVRVDSLSWYPDDLGLRAAFTFVPPRMEEDEDENPIPMYRVSPQEKLIGLPREWCLPPTPETDKRSLGHPVSLPWLGKYRSDEQERVFNESLGLLKNGRCHIVKATTGFGKTALGCFVASNLGVTTLIIVQKDDLMDQWRQSLKKFCGLNPEKIGLIQQDVLKIDGCPVVLAMVHSLVIDGKIPDWVTSHFGLVIFDEVHRMGAETFNRSCLMFSAKYRLGLSATVKRSDGKDPVFKAHIGPIMVETKMVALPPKVVIVSTKYKLPVVNRRVAEGDRMVWKRVPMPHSPARMMHVVKSIAQDEPRNNQILDIVYSCWRKGRNTIVFSHILDHLEDLYYKAQKRGIPPDVMSFYVGTGPRAKETDREKSRETSKVVWATYKMTAEGTDIPRLDCAVLATPMAHILQPVGRILREHDGKKEPVVFDLVDNEPGAGALLSTFASCRKREYYSLKGKVLTI